MKRLLTQQEAIETWNNCSHVVVGVTGEGEDSEEIHRVSRFGVAAQSAMGSVYLNNSNFKGSEIGRQRAAIWLRDLAAAIAGDNEPSKETQSDKIGVNPR